MGARRGSRARTSPMTRAGTPTTMAKSGTSASHHGPGADEGASANCQSGKNGGVAANRGPRLHARGNHLPVGGRLQPARFCGRLRVDVVGEDHSVADEHLVFDGHTFAEKAMR